MQTNNTGLVFFFHVAYLRRRHVSPRQPITGCKSNVNPKGVVNVTDTGLVEGNGFKTTLAVHFRAVDFIVCVCRSPCSGAGRFATSPSAPAGAAVAAAAPLHQPTPQTGGVIIDRHKPSLLVPPSPSRKHTPFKAVTTAQGERLRANVTTAPFRAPRIL